MESLVLILKVLNRVKQFHLFNELRSRGQHRRAGLVWIHRDVRLCSTSRVLRKGVSRGDFVKDEERRVRTRLCLFLWQNKSYACIPSSKVRQSPIAPSFTSRSQPLLTSKAAFPNREVSPRKGGDWCKVHWYLTDTGVNAINRD